MPEPFEIHSSTGAYRVTVGTNIAVQILLKHSDTIILIDSRLVDVLPPSITKIIAIEATEENKSLSQIAPVISQLRTFGAHRCSHLIAVGGGIIQDIATFVASIYMRGIPWSYCPTTLLGMVDSCIGGKSSINVGDFKNLVGNFYPPKEIVIDTNFLKTLNTEAVVAGLCEAAKISYARAESVFDNYLGDIAQGGVSIECAESIALQSLRAKQWFIETDEFDQKERLLLNFGHTFGHALETATDFRIQHGIAVGVGMLVAEAYAKQHGLLMPAGVDRVEVLSKHIVTLLQHINTLSSELAKLDLNKVIHAFDSDKKHLGTAYRVVLPVSEGNLELVSLPKTVDSRSAILLSYSSAIVGLSQYE